CAIGTLAPSAAKTITVTYTVPASALAGTATNSATVSATSADNTGANNTASDDTTVVGRADVKVTKSDSPDPVTAGNNITYTITVSNNSTASSGTTATNITLTDSLPANTNFVSKTGSVGVVCTGTGSISCSIPDLAPGASATVTYVVQVDPAFTGASVSNTASASSADTFDP